MSTLALLGEGNRENKRFPKVEVVVGRSVRSFGRVLRPKVGALYSTIVPLFGRNISE